MLCRNNIKGLIHLKLHFGNLLYDSLCLSSPVSLFFFNSGMEKEMSKRIWMRGWQFCLQKELRKTIKVVYTNITSVSSSNTKHKSSMVKMACNLLCLPSWTHSTLQVSLLCRAEEILWNMLYVASKAAFMCGTDEMPCSCSPSSEFRIHNQMRRCSL